MSPAATSAARVDDFLGLLGADLAGLRALVLTGRSGSGKSTLLRHLAAHHPALRDEPVRVLSGRPLPRVPRDVRPGEWVLVDEVLTRPELGRLLRLAARGARLLVASHLEPWAHLPLRLFGPLAVHRTDRDPAKLGRHLARRGLEAAPRDVARFARRYGASYTDLEILLECYPTGTFAQRLARFERSHQVALEPAGDAAPTARG